MHTIIAASECAYHPKAQAAISVTGDVQNICPYGKATIMGGGENRGGFAERFRGSGNIAVKVPDNMHPADAAPMLCAGITVWSPIKKYVNKPGMKVKTHAFVYRHESMHF